MHATAQWPGKQQEEHTHLRAASQRAGEVQKHVVALDERKMQASRKDAVAVLDVLGLAQLTILNR